MTVMPTVHQLSYVFIDDIPLTYVPGSGPDGYDFPEQVADVAQLGLPEPYAAVVTDIGNRPDDARCDGCDNPIGWELVEDDQLPSGGGLVFRPFSVVVLAPDALADVTAPGQEVQASARPAVVCEDCSPDVLYFIRPTAKVQA